MKDLVRFVRVDRLVLRDKCSVTHSVQPDYNLLYVVMFKGNRFQENTLTLW